jgi:hypothetical protein
VALARLMRWIVTLWMSRSPMTMAAVSGSACFPDDGSGCRRSPLDTKPRGGMMIPSVFYRNTNRGPRSAQG